VPSLGEKNADILAIAARPNLGVNKDTRATLDALHVTYYEAPLNMCCPEYGRANRIYAAAWEAENTSTTMLVALDSDGLFLDEPELLGPAFDVAVRPVDFKGSATSGGGDTICP
jgi:hypothetical protein